MPALMFEGDLSRLFRHLGNIPGNIRLGEPGLLRHRITFRGASCKEDCEGYDGPIFSPTYLMPSRLRPECPVEWSSFTLGQHSQPFSSDKSSFASRVTLTSLSKQVGKLPRV